MSPRVDGRNLYERVFCVVPIIGTGTWDDPKRPLFTPARGTTPTGPASNVLAFSSLTSDDGKWALVEFAVRDPKGLQALFAGLGANPQVLKTFQKGKNTPAEIEAEFKKYRKSFSLDSFRLVLP